MTLTTNPSCTTMRIVKPRPEIQPVRNTETFKGTYTRDPKYLAWVDEILNTNVNQVSEKCQ